MINSDKKNKVIFRTICFIMVFVVLFAYIEAISYDGKGIYPGWAYVYEDEIDVLIMGSSQAHSSFDAAYLTQQLNKSTVVLASGSQDIKQTYFNLLEVLKYQKPDIVFIESHSVIDDTLSWMMKNNNHGLILINLDGMKMSLTKLRSAFSTMGFEGYGVFQIMRNAGKTQRLISALSNIGKRTRNIFYPRNYVLNQARGYALFDATQDFGEKKWNDNLVPVIDYDFVLPKENVKYMEKIIRLCDKNDIDLEFVKVPQVKKSEMTSGHLAMIRLIEEKNYDVNAYNLMDPTVGLDFEMDDFGDINHLNAKGSKKTSDWLLNHLIQYYSNK